MKTIKVDNVMKIYKKGKGQIYALRGVNLEVEEGEFVAIFGPSGSGKTTLLMVMAGIIKPTSGSILYDSLDITKLSESQLAYWRHENIGFIFQNINLIPFLNVLDNVIIPMIPFTKNNKDLEQKALSLIELVGLSHRIRHKPSELSGGEQQRVAIARALINNPKVVFADEPTAHLDTDTGSKIVKLMKDISEEKKVTFIISTHDAEIAKISDRIIKIRDGKILNEE